jgi:phosphatidylserine/phosphatidylglycerophosphate/cardiolipin synthase-like enzyme
MASDRVNGVRPARGPFGKFGEPTSGNCVVVTIDGRDTFEQVYGHVLNAKRSVLIANYDLDPHLRFARNYPSAARHAIIKSACSKSLAVGSIAEESRRYTLQDLLVEKARNGVEIKIIVWQPRLVLRLLPGADERGIDGRADDVEILNGIAKSYGVGDKLQVKIDSTAPTLTSAHHEKIMVIDYEVGFCGGLDLSNGKWDTSAHDYDSQLRACWRATPTAHRRSSAGSSAPRRRTSARLPV